MIATTVYPVLMAHAPLVALIGTRAYRDFGGDAPAAPYLVWSILATVPGNHLSGRPLADRYSVSIDVFGRSRAESDALVVAARDAMEAIGQMTSGPQSLGVDVETGLWRYTLTVDVFLNR